MKHKRLTIGFAIIIIIALFVIYKTRLFSSKPPPEETHWGYLGAEGPEHWGQLSFDFKECEAGKHQSPINIMTSNIIKGEAADKIKINYNLEINSILNNGHTIQITFKNGSYIVLNNKKYELKQMHFHTPSENLINGERFPFEAHFVNISNDGKIAVLALLYNYSKEDNPFIKEIWDQMPKDVDNINSNLVIDKKIHPLPDGHYTYYEFTGSLTAPPCTESVEWLVLKEKSSISKEQVQTFEKTLTFDNSRPVQKAYDREVFSEN